MSEERKVTVGVAAGEPARADVRPGRIVVKCGTLEITAEHGAGGLMAGWKADVRMDGKPFPVRRLVLTIDVREAVSVVAEFFPKAAVPGWYVCEKCGRRQALGPGDVKKCEACGADHVRKVRIGEDVDAQPEPLIAPKQ